MTAEYKFVSRRLINNIKIIYLPLYLSCYALVILIFDRNIVILAEFPLSSSHWIALDSSEFEYFGFRSAGF